MEADLGHTCTPINNYVCSKRSNYRECDQDFLRADLLEKAIVEDVKSIFRNEQFMARLWEEANKRLTAEKPDLEKEIARTDAQLAKTRGAIERYFEAFEAGTLKAELCNEKIAGLRARVQEMEVEKQGLEARRERLELPAIDREMPASIMDNFEKVMAEGANPKKKHLLHRLVKKVLIHSRDTIEVWYCLPNAQRFVDCNIWLPKCASTRTRPGRVEPEVWFRIIHAALNGQNGTPVAAYCEQTVEIALGPKGAFENGNIGALRRRAPPDQLVSAIPPAQGDPKPPREPKTPRVVELLRKAIEWQALLESGKVTSQAEIANLERVSRARVTQIMGLLNLAPEAQEKILSMPKVVQKPSITERVLRPIATITDPHDQIREFHKLLG